MRLVEKIFRIGVSFILGCLMYACARGLQTYISIGTVFADWSWYLVVLALPFCLLLGMGFRLGRAKRWLGICAILCTLLLMGYGGFGHHFTLRVGPSPTPPITFWAATDVNFFSDTILTDVKEASGVLYLNADANTLRDPSASAELAIQIRRGTTQGIQFVLVPPVSDFVSAPVHREWMSNTQLAMAFAEANALPLRGFIADAEPPLDKPFDTLGRGASEVNRAAQNMRQFLSEAQRSAPQFKQEVTSIFPLFADGFDCDNDLAILLQSPVDPPENWDTLNLQAYTSYMLAESRGYYLWLLLRGMQTRYPDKHTTYLIGLAAPGFSWEPVLSEAELVRDARLARAMHVPEISVFHLRGALERFGDGFVARFTQAVRAPSPDIEVNFSRTASLAVFAIFAGDGLLDLRGSMLWVAVLWLAVCVLLMSLAHLASSRPDF